MAYTPKTWQCDDTITADELNRMEQGIADASSGGVEILTVQFGVTTPDELADMVDRVHTTPTIKMLHLLGEDGTDEGYHPILAATSNRLVYLVDDWDNFVLEVVQVLENGGEPYVTNGYFYLTIQA